MRRSSRRRPARSTSTSNRGRPQSDVLAGFGEAKAQRLAALKQEWDPDNMFRTNHNLIPTEG